MRNKKQFLLVILMMLMVPVVAIWYWLFALDVGRGKLVEVEIYSGSTIKGIADRLVDRELLRCPASLRVAARLQGADRELQAGVYRIPDTLSAWELVELLRQGSSEFCQVTVPEGLTAPQTAGILARELELDSLQLTGLITDSSFLAELQLNAGSLEGYLFPETYRFSLRQDPRTVLRELVEQHRQVWSRLQQDSLTLQYTPHQLVTVASIIQGEMRDTTEADLISSVYHNRLREGWKLQADPTVQYLLPDGPRRLLLADLEIDSPYNTYMYRGLPPGPVNSPGEAALRAAMAPATSAYFFFVADGSGRHLFSRTAAEHARARQTLDSLRRQLRRRN